MEKFFTNLIDYNFYNDTNIKDEDNYNYYILRNLEGFIIDNNNDVLIKKEILYELYYNKNENDKKTLKDNFYNQLLQIKKFCKEQEYKDEIYYKFDFYKIKRHLKLNEKEMKLKKILLIINDDNKPEKIKRNEIYHMLKDR